jgi:adenylate cyclase
LRISLKFNSVATVLFLAAMLTVALVTSARFEQTTLDSAKKSNLDQAEARANMVGVALEAVTQKMIVYGRMLMRDQGGKETGGGRPLIEADADFASLEVFGFVDGRLKPVARAVNRDLLASYDVKPDYLKKLDAKLPFPPRAVLEGGAQLKNRSQPKGVPLLTIGLPLAKDDQGRVSHLAIANVRFDALQKNFAEKGVQTVFLVDKEGAVIAHPDEQLAFAHKSLKALGIVESALTSTFRSGQASYVKPGGAGERFLAAFARTRFDLTAIAEAPERIILEPVVEARRVVFFITGLSITFALVIIAMLSLTITKPIARLVAITRRVARGDFDIQVARAVTSRDEIGSLAVRFDAMLVGLRERDKVKRLFNKFHGSSVTESLLAADKVSTGGVRAKVVVLFSDIRGFTATSEKTSPEDVVKMLNEYFTIMVAIVLKNRGIVDKFIGDAMMAIWGAPKGAATDVTDAIEAALQMREALAELNAKREGRGEEPIMIGIGLHTGEAISGNIGSDERMEYTVIGDTVNMASRIEASTKAFGADLLVSEDVAQAASGRFALALGGHAKVKGKTAPLALYKVVGRLGDGGRVMEVRTRWSDFAAEDADKVDVVPPSGQKAS